MSPSEADQNEGGQSMCGEERRWGHALHLVLVIIAPPLSSTSSHFLSCI